MKKALVLAVSICFLILSCQHHAIQHDLSSKVTAGGMIEAIEVRVEEESESHGRGVVFLVKEKTSPPQRTTA